MPSSSFTLYSLALLGGCATICSSLPSVSLPTAGLTELVKREDTCNPVCKPGFRVDQYAMPDCSWNCLSYTNTVIKVQPAIITGVATIIAAFFTYAGQRRVINAEQTVNRREIARNTTAFDKVTQELFGNPIALGQWNGVSLHDPLAGTLIGTLDNLLVEIQEHDDSVSALITVNDHSLLGARDENDQLTNAKVIYHNALVNGSPQARQFTDSERTLIGNEAAANFNEICQYYGRAMCDCVTSGYGGGFVGALTVQGQANNNGYFQQFDCDCDAARDEL